MNRIILSVFVKKNVYAILVLKDGKIVKQEVKFVRNRELNTYSQLVTTLAIAFRILRSVVEENLNTQEVVIEINNSTIIKWYNSGVSRDEYNDIFIESLKELNTIPVLYTFTYSDKPKAYYYADESKVEKPKITGLEDFM